MNLTLTPHALGGTVAAPASKSQAHRLLICGALSEKPVKIRCPETSADIDATVRCLCALGADISRCGDIYTVYPLEMPRGDAILDCGESGSTLRFLIPVVGALGISADFLLRGSLRSRPLAPFLKVLEQKGLSFSVPEDGRLHVEGRLQGGSFEIAGNISSQFISGLLMALPLTGRDSDIMLTTPLVSAPYVRMTAEALQLFGIRAEQNSRGWHLPAGQSYASCGRIAVEGDWTNAALWLCTGAVSAPVTVTGLNPASVQGDRKILAILEKFGAKVTEGTDRVTVSPAPLHSIEIDASDIPDLVPALALVGTCAEGNTRITGAGRLRYKESDRLSAAARVLNGLGGSVSVMADGLSVNGSALHGGSVDSFGDHRIAMLAGAASSVADGPIRLEGAEAVSKSYPRFWEDYKKLVIL